MDRYTLYLVLILGTGLVIVTSASPTVKTITIFVLAITLAYEFVRGVFREEFN